MKVCTYVVCFRKRALKIKIIEEFGWKIFRLFYVFSCFYVDNQAVSLILISKCKTSPTEYVSNLQYHKLKVCMHRLNV